MKNEVDHSGESVHKGDEHAKKKNRLIEKTEMRGQAFTLPPHAGRCHQNHYTSCTIISEGKLKSLPVDCLKKRKNCQYCKDKTEKTVRCLTRSRNAVSLIVVFLLDELSLG